MYLGEIVNDLQLTIYGGRGCGIKVGEDLASESVFPELSQARRASLSDEVLDLSRDAIIYGHFKPGYRLSESRLAEAFGVSRGPVREALTQLKKEGLVQIERHRGARVARISEEDVEELYELRCDLERLAAKRAVRLATAEEIEEMKSVSSAYEEAARSREVRESVDLDMRFHDLIYKSAHHTRLYSCWSTLLRSQIHAFVFSRSVIDPGYMVPCVSEHSAIYEAIRDRDREKAVEHVFHHLSTAYQRLVKLPFEWSE